MTKKMRALAKLHSIEGLWLQSVPVPENGPNDVLIRVRRTEIFGTNVHIWNWNEWAWKTLPLPLITGHEFAGEIVEIGRKVQVLSLGQRCSGEGHLIGTQSRRSRAGRFHLDPATRGIGVNAPGLHQHVTVTANIVSYFRSLFANSCRLDGHCRCLINHIPPAFLVLNSFHFLCQIETLKLQNSCCLAKCSPLSVDQHRRFFVET